MQPFTPGILQGTALLAGGGSISLCQDEEMKVYGYLARVVLVSDLAEAKMRRCEDRKKGTGAHDPSAATPCETCDPTPEHALRRIAQVAAGKGDDKKRGHKVSQAAQRQAKLTIERLVRSAGLELDAAHEAYAVARSGAGPVEETEAFVAELGDHLPSTDAAPTAHIEEPAA